jgi:hypothetical protein
MLQTCNNRLLVNNRRRCWNFRRESASRDRPDFWEKLMAHLFSQYSRPPRRSLIIRSLSVFRSAEVEFPPAAQPALELLDWTFRGSRAVDRASHDALYPQYNWLNTGDHYEISIPRENFTSTTSWRIPQAVRSSRRTRGFEGSRKKELLAENHGPLRRRR